MTTPPEEPSRAKPGELARKLAQEAREKADRERGALSDRLDVVERRLDAQGTTSIDVPARLAELSDRIAALEGSPNVSDQQEPFDWDDITDPDERAELQRRLTTWVHDVLVGRYGARLGRRGLAEGWWGDPLLRDVMTAAWLAWLGAYKHPEARLVEQWAWHRDVLGHLAKMLEEPTASRAQRERVESPAH